MSVSTVLVNAKMLPERYSIHSKLCLVRAEAHHEEVRAGAPVAIAHLHLAHFDSGGALSKDDVVQHRAPGVVLVREVCAAHLELLLRRKLGIVAVVERDVQQVLCGDVGDRVFLVEVARERRVDERRVVVLDPLRKV